MSCLRVCPSCRSQGFVHLKSLKSLKCSLLVLWRNLLLQEKNSCQLHGNKCNWQLGAPNLWVFVQAVGCKRVCNWSLWNLIPSVRCLLSSAIFCYKRKKQPLLDQHPNSCNQCNWQSGEPKDAPIPFISSSTDPKMKEDCPFHHIYHYLVVNWYIFLPPQGTLEINMPRITFTICAGFPF